MNKKMNIVIHTIEDSENKKQIQNNTGNMISFT